MSNEMHYLTSLGETLIKPYEMRCNVDCRSICKCRCDFVHCEGTSKNGDINSPAINTILSLPSVSCLFILGREFTLRCMVFMCF